MTDSTHSTKSDIQAILKARTEQAAKLRQATEAKPTLARATPPAITAQSIPATPTASAPPKASSKTSASAPAETPNLDKVVEQFLTEYLPNLIRKAEPTAQAMRDLFTPPFSIGELWAAATRARELGDAISVAVSEAVAVGAPSVKGLDALALVQVLVRFVLRRFVQPTVPAWIYPTLEAAVVGGVALMYETQIRPRLKGPRE